MIVWITRSTCMEYVGILKWGKGCENMDLLRARTSQSSWLIWSQVLHPSIMANSKGPWIYVSEWVRFAHAWLGTRWCCFARSSDVLDGGIRCASMVPNTVVSDHDIVAKIADWWHYSKHWKDGSYKNQLGSDHPEIKKGIRQPSPERQHPSGATFDNCHLWNGKWRKVCHGVKIINGARDII